MDLVGGGPQERVVGTRECFLVQTVDLPMAHREGSALLLLRLSGCPLHSSGLLERYSPLPHFRAFCGIIPAWLVRASEGRTDLA